MRRVPKWSWSAEAAGGRTRKTPAAAECDDDPAGHTRKQILRTKQNKTEQANPYHQHTSILDTVIARRQVNNRAHGSDTRATILGNNVRLRWRRRGRQRWRAGASDQQISWATVNWTTGQPGNYPTGQLSNEPTGQLARCSWGPAQRNSGN